jgi:hypothetical protein
LPEIKLGPAPHCCAHLAGVSGGGKTYLGSSKILINYPALSAAIGGQDGMDGGRAHWMTLPKREAPSKLMLGCAPRCWAQLALFFSGVKMYICSITLINTYSFIYLAIGCWEGVDAGGANRMTIPFWEASVTFDGDRIL